MSAEDNTNGPWRITSAREVFDNPWINVKDHAVVHPDGSPGQYGVIRFKNLAIGVLPIDADGCTVLVGQHRFPHNSYSWELPEGGGALTVPPVEAAKRELEEETGLKAQSWAPLCDFDISNSITDEKAVCFLAWDLALGNAQPDPSEALTIKRVSFKDLLEMVMSGEIRDSLTIVMTLKAYAMALRGEAPAPISESILAAGGQK